MSTSTIITRHRAAFDSTPIPCAAPECQFFGLPAALGYCSFCAQRPGESKGEAERRRAAWISDRHAAITERVHAILRHYNVHLMEDEDVPHIACVVNLAADPFQCVCLLREAVLQVCERRSKLLLLTPEQTMAIANISFSRFGAREEYWILSHALMRFTFMPWRLPAAAPFHDASSCYHGNYGELPYDDYTLHRLTNQALALLTARTSEELRDVLTHVRE